MQRLGDHRVHPALHQLRRGQITQHTEHGQLSGGPGLGDGGGDHRQARRGQTRRTDEHERQLFMGGVPGRGRGVGKQHRGVDGQGRREKRGFQSGGPLHRAQHGPQRAQRDSLAGHAIDLGRRGHPDADAESAQNPRAEAHRRGQLDGSHHVDEALGPTQVLHQRHCAQHHSDQGGQSGVAAQRVSPGELGAGRQQTGPARHATQEQVRRHLVAPRRGLDHRAPVVRGELGFGDHRHLARAVRNGFAALTFSVPASLAAGRLRRSQAVELRRRHRLLQNASAAAPNMPAAASPARLNMVGRSAVHTRGSGGRP